MTDFTLKYYSSFYNEAIKSELTHRLAAGIIVERKLVSKPYCNTNRNYYRGVVCGSIHAEANALLHYFGKNLQFDKVKKRWCHTNEKKPKKINLFVMRFMKCGVTGNARPCFNCLKMMKDIGINKVYYSTGNGYEIISESVKDMVSIQSSAIMRLYDSIRDDICITNIYFENLIKKLFPKKIKENNLFYFLKYNLKNLLPSYTYIITNLPNLKIIIIYNDKNQIVINSEII